MLKTIIDFLTTGVALVVTYGVYLSLAIAITFMLGLPIGIGIHMIIEFMKLYVFPIMGNN